MGLQGGEERNKKSLLLFVFLIFLSGCTLLPSDSVVLEKVDHQKFDGIVLKVECDINKQTYIIPLSNCGISFDLMEG
jgi:hypothetical protein